MEAPTSDSKLPRNAARETWEATLRGAGIDPAQLPAKWEPGPLPDELIDAVHALTHRDAQFVLTRQRTGESRPRPCWHGWPDARPSADRVVQHLQGGGSVGIVPASVGTSALDVDQGDPAPLVEVFPALAELATRRGVHLYYPDERADQRRGGPFRSDAFGVAGDVKAGPGQFLRLDHGERAVIELAERVIYGPDRWYFPDNPLATFEAVEQGVLFPARHSPAPGSRSPGIPPVWNPSVALATEGVRNNSLFRALWGWGLTCEVGHSRADWDRAVLEHGRAINATMADPLPDWEVRGTAYSAAGYRWDMPSRARVAALAAVCAAGGRAGVGESKAPQGAKGGRAGRGEVKAPQGAIGGRVGGGCAVAARAAAAARRRPAAGRASARRTRPARGQRDRGRPRVSAGRSGTGSGRRRGRPVAPDKQGNHDP